MPETLPGALKAARTPAPAKPAPKADAEEKTAKTEDEKSDEVTADERREAREAYLRAWPLEAYETR